MTLWRKIRCSPMKRQNSRPMLLQQKVSLKTAAADATADTAATDPTTTVPARTEEPSFIGELLGNLWFWISAAVVLLLALFVARRRKDDADEDFDAAATGGDWATAAADADHEETMRDLEAVAEPEASMVVEESSVEDALARQDDGTSDATAQLENLLDFGDEGRRRRRRHRQ